jgi:hypothetical protein
VPRFGGEFVSVVLIGSQNPQILTHDFLVRHNILPSDEEPFRELLAREEGNQFTEYVSVPVMTSLSYGPVSLIVEQNRYQARDSRFSAPAASPIFGITRRYFRVLPHTPFKLGGINLNGTIAFDDMPDERALDESLGIRASRLSELVGRDDFRAGLSVSCQWHGGTIEIQMPKPKDRLQPAAVNFNYEFGYTDIDSFLSCLDDVSMVYDRFCEFLGDLKVSY